MSSYDGAVVGMIWFLFFCMMMGHRGEEFVPSPEIEVGCFNIVLSLVVTVSYKGDSMVYIK